MKRLNKDEIFEIVYRNSPRVADSAIRKCKEEEEIGWKLCKDTRGEPVLVKLLIPTRAYRTWYKDPYHEKYAKHRCSRAKVLGFYSYYTGKEVTDKYKKNCWHVFSIHDKSFQYVPGTTVFPEWGGQRNPLLYSRSCGVCDSGIHYFKTKESVYMWADLYMASYFIFSGVPRRRAYFPPII